MPKRKTQSPPERRPKRRHDRWDDEEKEEARPQWGQALASDAVKDEAEQLAAPEEAGKELNFDEGTRWGTAPRKIHARRRDARGPGRRR